MVRRWVTGLASAMAQPPDSIRKPGQSPGNAQQGGPDHLRYYRVGTDVIIADTAGEVVADVVYDILKR